jgi:hypothetical protein
VKKDRLAERIKKKGRFLYAAFHTTIYPNRQNRYTTIEVIEKKSPERLAFVHPNNNNTTHLKQSDLIAKMQEYDTLGWKLGYSKQLTVKNLPCPVYHCSFGFNHPKLNIS